MKPCSKKNTNKSAKFPNKSTFWSHRLKITLNWFGIPSWQMARSLFRDRFCHLVLLFKFFSLTESAPWHGCPCPGLLAWQQWTYTYKSQLLPWGESISMSSPKENPNVTNPAGQGQVVILERIVSLINPSPSQIFSVTHYPVKVLAQEAREVATTLI